MEETVKTIHSSKGISFILIDHHCNGIWCLYKMSSGVFQDMHMKDKFLGRNIFYLVSFQGYPTIWSSIIGYGENGPVCVNML